MKVDVHNHVIPQPVLDLIARTPALGVELSGDRWSGGTVGTFTLVPAFRTAEGKLEELARHGLDGAVLSAAPMIFNYHVDAALAAEVAREANRGMAELCAQAPDRLWWMATIPLQAPDLAIEILEEATAAGCAGLELATSAPDAPLDDARFDALWAAVARRTPTVLLHPAYPTRNPALAPYYLGNVVGHLVETTVALERLLCAGHLDRHPELTLILAHGGGFVPYQLGRLRHARRVRPELAGAPEDPWAYAGRFVCDVLTHDAGALEYLVGRIGVENVVLGTDLPFDMADGDAMALVSAVLGDADAAVVAEHNPSRLFKLMAAVEMEEGSR